MPRRTEDGSEGVDWAVKAAIEEACTAGVYRRAERLNVKTSKTWAALAGPHSRRAKAHLDDAMLRLGVVARPRSRMER